MKNTYHYDPAWGPNWRIKESKMCGGNSRFFVQTKVWKLFWWNVDRTPYVDWQSTLFSARRELLKDRNNTYA